VRVGIVEVGLDLERKRGEGKHFCTLE
jgi:hypothetical protein